MKMIVVIPTYNERENIVPLIVAIEKLKISDLEILIVDDNSPDGTAAQVAEQQKIYPRNLHLLKRPNKLGLGSAYIDGFTWALAQKANLILEMDADFSHDPNDLPRLIAACQNGADLSLGSRKIPNGKIIGWDWRRRVMSAGAMFVARTFLKLRTSDVTSGFRCFKRRALESINLNKIKSNGYAFQEEVLYRVEKMGFTTVEIPVIFLDRQHGHSKLAKKDIWEFFKLIFKLKYQQFFNIKI